MGEETKFSIEEHIVNLKSGVVGIYKNPPGVGNDVKEGDTLGFIQQLTFKNEIFSPYEGVINYAIKNNSNVEYGQKIISIIPKGYSLEKIMNEEEAVEEEGNENNVILRSPLNSTFYLTPQPGAPSYVNKGDLVEKDSILCLLEAMKCYSETKLNDFDIDIKGDVRVKHIYPENGSVVNGGDKLFLVELVS